MKRVVDRHGGKIWAESEEGAEYYLLDGFLPSGGGSAGLIDASNRYSSHRPWTMMKDIGRSFAATWSVRESRIRLWS